jgi:hypothetical protein
MVGRAETNGVRFFDAVVAVAGLSMVLCTRLVLRIRPGLLKLGGFSLDLNNGNESLLN